MVSLYVNAESPVNLNRNTDWFMYPEVWTICILILFFAGSLFFPSSKKGTPFAEDQGMYNGLTWWEQIDNGKQLTPNIKFLTIVPVILYLIASHTTDYQHPMLFFNTIAVVVLVVAKFPNMHK
ncbi:hypothetical protein Golob_017000, partial [Gossypium lobatum]|nr:hypothetical protein [Gossypium lobatum]